MRVKVGLLFIPSGWVPFEWEWDLDQFGDTWKGILRRLRGSSTVRCFGRFSIYGPESWTLCQGITGTGETFVRDQKGYQDVGLIPGLFVRMFGSGRPYGDPVGSLVLEYWT